MNEIPSTPAFSASPAAPSPVRPAGDDPVAASRMTADPVADSDSAPVSLEAVFGRRDTWRGREMLSALPAANSAEHRSTTLPTGFGPLDAQLSEGGWPLDSTVEVLSDAGGMGAMGLFLPSMERLSSQQRWQAFIAPPHIPYAPLLAARGIDIRQVLLVHPKSREEILWCTEQALRSTTCSAVFSWLGAFEYRYAELRRLQLAAAGSRALAVLFRSRQAACEHAPASLRLDMHAYREVHILKQRGGRQGVDVYLPPEDDVPHQPQLWELPADHSGSASRAAL
jgi:protein ImuA